MLVLLRLLSIRWKPLAAKRLESQHIEVNDFEKRPQDLFQNNFCRKFFSCCYLTNYNGRYLFGSLPLATKFVKSHPVEIKKTLTTSCRLSEENMFQVTKWGLVSTIIQLIWHSSFHIGLFSIKWLHMVAKFLKSIYIYK